MEIKEYDFNTRVEYSVFVKKINKSDCMSTLNIQTFSEGKKIILLIEQGFFRKYKIIGYTIIYEDLQLCFFNNISERYNKNSNTIFISDFMINYPYRKQGIGKYFAKYIIDEVYKQKNIILQPDGDGNWFWKKFGFIPDNISKNLTLILKRNREMEGAYENNK